MNSLKKITTLSLIIITLIIGSSFFIPTETILVRIYSHLKINALTIGINTGSYRVVADGNFVSESAGELSYKLVYKEDSIELSSGDKVIGKYKYIKLISEGGGELKIRLVNPDRKQRIYQENLIFSTFENYIKIINDVEVDKYIAGVTEAETGTRWNQEFYKVQAILARTFALAHINKHVLEGHSLCDQVHCQVYYGKPRDLSIPTAVEATRNLVVVDDNLNLIIAAFHSNSGGQTANSEDVWGAKTSYLRSVTDSFSVKMPNANWQRKMLTEDWLTYLKLKHNYPTDNPLARDLALNFQQTERKAYLEASNVKVPLKFVRQDLQLKSTFFSIKQLNNDSVLFLGRGYGHGLGMCQEGAMKMSKQGYSYQQILNFYYKNIKIIDMKKLRFFKDE
ncbi:MAG: SpoIID/LytB domain-containing protein [Sphingobacteriaceae bacterium]